MARPREVGIGAAEVVTENGSVWNGTAAEIVGIARGAAIWSRWWAASGRRLRKIAAGKSADSRSLAWFQAGLGSSDRTCSTTACRTGAVAPERTSTARPR